MKPWVKTVMTLAVGLALHARGEAVPGNKAPAFSLQDSNGQTVTLDQYAGKFVVLEWINHDCPFVKKHYGSGNMQALQKTYTEKGVVWLSICSSAPGKQGYNDPAGWNTLNAEKGSKATALLLDTSGDVGRAYGAKTTPHMFVINPEGVLLYNGAIDDQKSFDPASVPKAVNYVVKAVDAAMAGKPVEPAKTRPYGCSVKY